MRPWKLFGPGARGKQRLYPEAAGKVRGRESVSIRAASRLRGSRGVPTAS